MSPLERATPAYAEAMATVHAASFPPGERWGRDAIALQLGLPGAFGLVSTDGGFILARIAADEAEVLTLAVHPDCRRAGLGHSLVSRALAVAGERGAGTMFLEVSARNGPAQRLYAACGFVEIARRPGYYARGVDALVLRAVIACGSAAG